jgi:3-oxoadipyl-CoA thiolase
MGETGENVADRWTVTREDQDAFALRSQQRAGKAIAAGYFAKEIVPVEAPGGKAGPVAVDKDEHPRPDTTAEQLAKLKTFVRSPGTLTAGNASGVNDGAAALILVSSDYAKANGLTPLAKIVSWASTGTNPRDTGLGPILSIPKALDRAGMTVADLDLAEINEAFASVPVAACRKLGLSEDITNVSGSGCSLGHPVACTGARMIITTMFELRRRGGGIGMASMCAGGGMGSATIFEVYPG